MAAIEAAVEFVPVSREAIYKRVNRVLSRRGEKIVAGVGHSQKVTGNWFMVNEQTQQISGTHFDLEAVARALGVLAAYEKLESESDGR